MVYSEAFFRAVFQRLLQRLTAVWILWNRAVSRI